MANADLRGVFFVLLASLGVASPALAIPSVAVIPEGGAAIVQDGGRVAPVLNWETFVIDPDHQVNFLQPSPAYSVLTRVTGDRLFIGGNLQIGAGADIRVWSGRIPAATGSLLLANGGTLVIRPASTISLIGGSISVTSRPAYPIPVLTVPEPHVLPMMAGGLMLIGLVGFRRQGK